MTDHESAQLAGELSRYRIVDAIGAGGMGEVFLAEDTHLSRRVALKMLPEEICRDATSRRRFLQEARAAAKLNHPNICTVYDAGEGSDGRVFITMEYIDGTTLGEKSHGVALPLGELLGIALQVGGALEEAHRHGVVHRDLKPGNLMFTSRGDIKVVDFGIAKIVHRPDGTDDPDGSTLVKTSPGTVGGTVPYMSPEQAFGDELDARSDIFSFGTVMYEMASGRLPFTGNSSVEIIAGIAQREPPEIARAPAELVRVIRKCLQKDRSMRYQSMTEVVVDLRALLGTVTGQRAAAPLRAQSALGNLPVETSSFVGRENEIAELCGLLEAERLLTITGAGGSGKSRLAIETARRSLKGFADGVCHVSLSTLGSSDSIVAAVAGALGIREQPGTPLIESLLHHACGCDILLVVDGCEHVLDEAARAIDALLRSGPGIRVLATSREPLNVAGECVWTAPPLSLPPAKAAITAGALASYDAISLFVERARSSQPRFVLSDANAGAIAQICIRLDGIPLAIELAAARLRAMSAGEIRGRLDDCFRILTGGSRAALPRHQTMRAAVDWSHDLLSDSERACFRRLGLFPGAFDLAAAEGVCGWGELDPPDVLDHLTRLIDKSLVILVRDEADNVRYRLLEPLRQYAVEKLGESGDAGRAAKRHFVHYAALAEQAYDQRIESSAHWLERLEREHDNLRAALDWAGSNERGAELGLAGALAWFWQLHSHFAEGRQRLRHVLAGETGRTRDTARALWGASSLAVWQGDIDQSREPAEEGVAIWRELGELKEVALALEPIGFGLLLAEEYEKALACFRESLAIHESLGDERLINRATLNICQVLVAISDVAAAEPMAEKALAIAIRHDEIRDIHNALHFLADCALIRGDAALAEERYAESLRAVIRYGDRLESIFEVEGVAMSAAGQGRDAKALRLAAAAEAESESLKTDMNIAFWNALKQRYLGPAEARLGAEATATARRLGREMGFEAAIELALALGRD